jgi:malonyl-CoA O-methyltransferase
MSALPVREAYRLWAPEYERETVVSALESRAVDELGIETSGRALLDAGCGTARRLRASDAAVRIGVDLSVEMLQHARSALTLVAGDVQALPVASDAFDVVWCRLAIGHVRHLESAYRELARVCRTNGSVVVSDLAPDAAAAGHRRTFRGADGATHEVEHFVHALSAHVTAGTRVGLTLAGRRDGLCGPSVRSFYAEAGRLRAYEEQRGTTLVVVLAWHKAAG